MATSHRRKKRPATASRKTKIGTTSGKKTTTRKKKRRVVQAPTPYVCSKCDYREEEDSEDLPDPNRFLWSDKKPKAEWRRCPNDGGLGRAYLVDSEVMRVRIRLPLEHVSPVVRVCTPGWPKRISGRLVLWPLVSLSEMQREAYLEDYLEAHGPDDTIDVSHVTGKGRFGTDWNVMCSKAMSSIRPSYQRTIDDWRRRIGVLRRQWPRSRRRLHFRIADVIDPTWGLVSADNDRTIYVGVDLRLAVEAQLKEAQQRLLELRRYLYRFTQKVLPRDRSENLWRDIYIVLLLEIEGNSVAEIGEEVFPKHKRKSREYNVRQIIRKMKKALDTAGVRSLLDG